MTRLIKRITMELEPQVTGVGMQIKIKEPPKKIHVNLTKTEQDKKPAVSEDIAKQLNKTYGTK